MGLYKWAEKRPYQCDYCGQSISLGDLYLPVHWSMDGPPSKSKKDKEVKWDEIVCENCFAKALQDFHIKKLDREVKKMAEETGQTRIIAHEDGKTKNFTKFQIKDNEYGIRGTVLVGKRNNIPGIIMVELRTGE